MKYCITYVRTFHTSLGEHYESKNETFVHFNIKTLKNRYLKISRKIFKDIDEDILGYDNDERFNDFMRLGLEHFENDRTQYYIILSKKG